MPRGVKGSGEPRAPRKTVNDKIAAIDAKIEKLKQEIAELTAQKKELENIKEQKKTSELLKVMEESGLSADELLEIAKTAKK